MKMSTLNKNLAMSLIAISLFSGCSKERETYTPQGQGNYVQNLTDISALTVQGSGKLLASEKDQELKVRFKDLMDLIEGSESGKLMALPQIDTLSTTSVTYGKGNFNKSTTVTLEEGSEKIGINNLAIVKYTTNSIYLDGIAFRGKTDTNYEIRYALSDKYFNVLKVGTKETIPSNEHPYAMVMEDGRLLVPVVGYPIEYIKMERQKDSYQNDTNRLIEIRVQKKEEATHFRINQADRIVFDPITRDNIFPAELFNTTDEWFYAATLISAENKSLVGRDLSEDLKNQAVSRVKFKRNEKYLVAVNLNIADRLSSDEINYKEALRIPVEWLDFSRKRNGTDRSYDTMVIDNDNKDSRSWDSRDYVQLKLKDVESNYMSSLNKAFGETSTLSDLKISDEVISFSVGYAQSKTKIRYVLKKAQKPVVGRNYFESDRHTFGFFTTLKDHLQDHTTVRQEDQEKLILLNRHYPVDNVIKFYFTNISTKNQNVRDIAREAVKIWSDTFHKAGSPIKVVMDESMEVDLGDIRYNAINLVDQYDDGSLLGYGPSIVDTLSGQIIASTANIYVNPIRESMIGVLRNYVKARVGAYGLENVSLSANGVAQASVQDVVGLAQLSSDTSDKNAKSMLDTLASYSMKSIPLDFSNATKVAQVLTPANQKEVSADLIQNIEALKLGSLDTKNKKIALMDAVRYGQCQHYGIHNAEVITDIKKLCPGMEDYVAEVTQIRDGGSKAYHTAREMSVIGTCAEVLMRDSVLGTMVHEMGHNFGLRHNFHGSYDKENFYTKEETNSPEQIRVSSVMEYMPGNHHELLVAGKYDIAAIRFGYADTIELDKATNDSESRFLKLDTSMSITENLVKSQAKAKKFLYCTDEDVSIGYDPTCQRHDFGTTPSEIVDSIILEHKSRLETGYKRFDKATFSASDAIGLYITNVVRTYNALGSFYRKFRYDLDKQMADDKNPYLEEMSIEALEQRIKSMVDDAVTGKTAAQYREAANKSFAYLFEIMNHPDLFCIVKNAEGVEQALNFKKTQELFYQKTKATVSSCDDQRLLADFDSQKLTLVRQVGHPVKGVKASLDMKDTKINDTTGRLDDSLEIAGLEWDKMYAGISLMARRPLYVYGLTSTNMAESFLATNFVNYVDEPGFRMSVIESLFSRILYGIPSSQLGIKNAGPVEIFADEKLLITTWVSFLIDGLSIPSNIEASDVRKKGLQIYSTEDERIVEQLGSKVAKTKVLQVNYYTEAEDSNGNPTKAAAVISKRNELLDLKQLVNAIGNRKIEEALPLISTTLNNLESVYRISLNTEEEFTKVPMVNYLNFVAQVSSFVTNLKTSDFATYYIFVYMFKDEFDLFNVLTPEIRKNLGENMNLPVKAFMDKYKGQFSREFVLINKDTLGLVGAMRDSQVTTLREMVQLYKSNRTEYEAKRDILTQMLSIL